VGRLECEDIVWVKNEFKRCLGDEIDKVKRELDRIRQEIRCVKQEWDDDTLVKLKDLSRRCLLHKLFRELLKLFESKRGPDASGGPDESLKFLDKKSRDIKNELINHLKEATDVRGVIEKLKGTAITPKMIERAEDAIKRAKDLCNVIVRIIGEIMRLSAEKPGDLEGVQVLKELLNSIENGEFDDILEEAGDVLGLAESVEIMLGKIKDVAEAKQVIEEAIGDSRIYREICGSSYNTPIQCPNCGSDDISPISEVQIRGGGGPGASIYVCRRCGHTFRVKH